MSPVYVNVPALDSAVAAPAVKPVAVPVQLVKTPDLIEFLDHISIEGDSDVNLEELSIDVFKSGCSWNSIAEPSFKTFRI